MSEFVSIKDLVVDPELQVRVKINQEMIDDYAVALARGDEFPPVVVFDTDEGLLLADGYHRLEAHKKAGKRKIAVEIKEGDRRDAILFGVSANITHGQRLTNEDKRKAASKLLTDAEWSTWSDNEISKRLGVTQPFISKVRRELLEAGIVEPQTVRLAKRGDDVYSIDVEKITETPKNPKGRPPSKVIPISEIAKTLTSLPEIKEIEEDDEESLEEEYIEEIEALEITPDRLLYLSSVKVGDRWQLGDNYLYVNSLSKLQKKLPQFEYCLFYDSVENLVSVQSWLKDKVDFLSILVPEGQEVLKLIDVDLLYQSGTLLILENRPVYLGHYGLGEMEFPDGEYTHKDLFVNELLESLTEENENILIVNPPYSVLHLVNELGKSATVVTTDPSIAQTELIAWEERYGAESPVTKL